MEARANAVHRPDDAERRDPHCVPPEEERIILRQVEAINQEVPEEKREHARPQPDGQVLRLAHPEGPLAHPVFVTDHKVAKRAPPHCCDLSHYQAPDQIHAPLPGGETPAPRTRRRPDIVEEADHPRGRPVREPWQAVVDGDSNKRFRRDPVEARERRVEALARVHDRNQPEQKRDDPPHEEHQVTSVEHRLLLRGARDVVQPGDVPA
mmetsp:Transcript_25680/g.61309  ORF Transcript_25680/g.61309 Transcript_25680/m.61309 type:complete len:208 (-) Transcript_25680:3-626(-)